MKRLQLVATVIALAATLGGPGASLAQEEHTAPGPVSPGVGGEMFSRFYSGSVVKTGSFTGKLVCLRCDLKPSPEAMKQCEKEGHRHALSMDRDSMIHPLLAGTKEAAERINSADLHGKEVVVTGKYYSSGVIFVSAIEEKK